MPFQFFERCDHSDIWTTSLRPSGRGGGEGRGGEREEGHREVKGRGEGEREGRREGGKGRGERQSAFGSLSKVQECGSVQADYQSLENENGSIHPDAVSFSG